MSLGEEVSTSDLASTVFNDSSQQISTSSTAYNYLRKATGTITLPDSFANRAWGMGSRAGARPDSGDRRLENPGNTQSTVSDQILRATSAHDNWPEWYVVSKFDPWDQGAASAAINSFVKCLQPGRLHRFKYRVTDAHIDRKTNNTEPLFSVSCWGYSSGYLSGSRTQYSRWTAGAGGSSGWIRSYDGNHTFTPSASYPYLVINVEALSTGGQGYGGIVDGTVSMGEITVE